LRAQQVFRALTAVWLAVCAAGAPRSAGAAEVLDDAWRRVALPDVTRRVFAAGAPAEVLLYTLVPEMLVGRNHQPSPQALELTPPELRSLPTIVNLPDRDDARYDSELVALRPDVYVDYGTVDDDYVAALEAISARTRVPGIILDGRLENVPQVYRRLGAALGVAERGEETAVVVERILEKYRGALTARPVRAYLACSADGLMPCLGGHSFGEAAAWLGAINVAGTVETAPRRAWTLAEIAAAPPDVAVAVDAARLRGDPAWQAVPAVAAGRVRAPPTEPFNWGPRPPSVNRVLGVVWLAYFLPGREVDAEFLGDVRALMATLYHVDVSDERIRALVGDR